MTMGAPAGWFPDPYQPGAGALRWWDGARWTEHATGPGGAPRVDVGAEERLGRWARIALVCAIPSQLLVWVLTRAIFVDLFDRLDELDRADSEHLLGDNPLLFTGSQLFQVLLLGVGIVFLLWFHRSAVNARGLGLPARREPGLATASFIIPVVNLWWPYQSTCDLFPPGDPARRRVLAWFLLWCVGGCVSTGLVIASAAVDGPLVVLFFAPAAFQIALAALAACQVVSEALETHRGAGASAVP